MWTTFFNKLSSFISTNTKNSKFVTNSFWRSSLKTQELHDWKRRMSFNQENRKIIPKLIYLHNPWKWLLTKFNLLKFKVFWDPDFEESEFIRGAKQAAVVLTNIIRNQNSIELKQLTTPLGYKQISRDMQLSRGDGRLNLVRFEAEHLRRAIPMRVVTKLNNGRRFCFIDMLFVGVRNTKDFDSVEEALRVKEILQKLDSDVYSPVEVLVAPHRIIFAEIFIRFRRDYTEYTEEFILQRRTNTEDDDWSVAFYKILSFDILNYDVKQ